MEVPEEVSVGVPMEVPVAVSAEVPAPVVQEVPAPSGPGETDAGGMPAAASAVEGEFDGAPQDTDAAASRVQAGAVAAAQPAAGRQAPPAAADGPQDEWQATAAQDEDVPPWDMDIPAFPPSGDDLPGEEEREVRGGREGKPRPARPARQTPVPSPRAAGGRAAKPGVIALHQPWYELAASLPVTGLASELARHSEWLGVQGNTIRLKVAARTLTEVNGRDRLRQCLEEYFGCRVNLDIEVAETGEGTAYAVDEAVRAERQRVAEETVQADPFVQELEQDFEARVYPGSVRAVMPEADGKA